MNRVKFLGYSMWVPGHWILRGILGFLLILGGFFSFLPVLGVWMLPLGLIVLSIDFPMVRRFRRWATVLIGLKFQNKWPNLARRLGFRGLRSSRVG
jgi:purine-cytosine permease-like protein